MSHEPASGQQPPSDGTQQPYGGTQQPYGGGASGQGGYGSSDQRPAATGDEQPYQPTYQPTYEQGHPPTRQQEHQQGHQPPHQQEPRQGHASSYQRPYQPGYQQPYQQGYRSIEGEKAAQLSLILGIVGFFFAGIILGPLAIWQAGKAERLGVPATAGKVLGWVGTILWGLSLLLGIGFFILVLVAAGSSGSFS